MQNNNIPDDATFMSDSGWEGAPTDMEGIYYDEEKNIVIFTQDRDDEYEKNPYRLLYYNPDEVLNWKWIIKDLLNNIKDDTDRLLVKSMYYKEREIIPMLQQIYDEIERVKSKQ